MATSQDFVSGNSIKLNIPQMCSSVSGWFRKMRVCPSLADMVDTEESLPFDIPPPKGGRAVKQFEFEFDMDGRRRRCVGQGGGPGRPRPTANPDSNPACLSAAIFIFTLSVQQSF